MLCNDPFSQYLYDLYEQMIQCTLKVVRHLLKYDKQMVRRLDKALILDDVGMLQNVSTFIIDTNRPKLTLRFFSRSISNCPLPSQSFAPYNSQLEAYHDHVEFTLRQIRKLDLFDCYCFPCTPIERSVH